MKPRRDKSASKAPPQPRSTSWPERLRTAIDVSAVGLAIASTLVPSEGSIHAGTYALLATCWCLLLVAWAALAYFSPGSSIRLGWTEILGGAFVLWHSVAAIAWLGRGNDRQSLNALWLVVGYALTVFLLRQVATSALRARVVIVLLLWLATTLASTGYVEYFVTRPAQRAAYQKNPDEILEEQHISGDADSTLRMLFENRLHSVEPLATFSLTNSLAGFLAPWLIVALAVALATLREPGLRRALVGAALIAALIAGCLLLTKSRTAVLATLAGLVLLALYGRQSGWRIGWRLPAIAVGVLVVIGLGVVYVGGLDAEVLSEAPKSVLYRLEYWRSTAAMIADHPLFGCGPGNFQETYASYKLPQASEMVADPHNFLLEVWATAGTPAIVLLLAMFAALAVDLSRIASRQPGSAGEEPPPGAAIYFGGGLAGLVLGFAFAALVGIPLNTFGDMAIPIVWWVGLPLLAAVWWLLRPWIEHGELPVGAVVVALLVLAINLLAAGAVVFPGVIVTALVLLPVATQLGGQRDWSLAAQPFAPRDAGWASLPGIFSLSRGAAGALCGAAFVVAVLCLQTEYRPVLTARMQLGIAFDRLLAREPDAAKQAALAASQADPWSPEPWHMLADIRLQHWMAEPDAAKWSEFVAAAEEFRRRNPRHHAQFFQRGNWCFFAWQRTGEARQLEEALAAYNGAIDRYPNHALYHGQLAWALHATGQSESAREAADRAKALDDAMPHEDQKLSRRRITDWQASPAGTQTQRPETAEQTIERLRKTNTRQTNTGRANTVQRVQP